MQYFILFSSFRFNQIQDNTNLIWKFQQFQLLKEYSDSYAFPPPLNAISYIILAYNKFIKKEDYSTQENYLNELSQFNFLPLEERYALDFLSKSKLNDEMEEEEDESNLQQSNQETFEGLEKKLEQVIKENGQLKKDFNIKFNQVKKIFYL